MKKLLSLLLVVAMCLGIASTAFAVTATTTPSTVAGAAFSDIAGSDAEGDITLLSTRGIMQGDAGATTVRPDSTITRVEFAAMVVRMLGKGTLATSLNSMKPNTKDAVDTWAWGYVNVVQSMGIMQGDPDGSFRPKDNVTFAEALAMLERAIGQDKKVTGTWPTNVLLVADDLSLGDGVDVFANTPATRGEIAIMMVNTMNTKKFLGYADDGTEKTQPAILAASTVTGLVTALTASSNDVTIDWDSDADKAIESEPYKLATTVNLVGAKSFADLLNVNVKAIFNSDDEIVYMEVVDDANTIVGTLDEFTTNDDGDNVIALNDGKEYVVNIADVKVEINNKTGFTWANVAKIDADASVVLTLVDDEVVYIDATQVSYKDALVDKKATVDADDDTLYYLNTTAGDNFEVTTSTPVTIDGAAKKVTDLAADDVVYLTVKADALGDDTTVDVLSVEAFRATVKGEVTKIKTAADATVTVTLKLADGTAKAYVLDQVGTPNIGDTVEYRLNKAGKARLQVGASAATTVVYVTDTYSQNTGTTHYYAELDVAGVAKTIEVNQEFFQNILPDHFGTYVDNKGAIAGVIEYDADTAASSDWTAVATDTTHDIVSIDATNGVVVIGTDILGVTTGVAVYQDNGDGTYTAAALSDLSKDLTVDYDAETGLIVIPD